MSFLASRVYDFGLSVLDTEANVLMLCSAEPTTYTQAVTTFALGNASGSAFPGISAPENASPDGRRVVIGAITLLNPGIVTADGTGGFWALVDTVNTRLLAAGPVDTPQAVVTGNPFTLDAFAIRIPAPV